MIDTTILLGTDVACLLIFHPNDLAHANGWPIAWYADPAIYPVESAAGRLMGWHTGGDGGYAVRLTNGVLTERERTYAGPSWVFPLTVRHGRVFLDNSDGLPGVEQMVDPSATPEQWIEIRNGCYAVTVTGIEWQAEPDAETLGDQALPTYVVTFAQTADIATPARRPPDLEPYRDAVASDSVAAPVRHKVAPVMTRGPLAVLASDKVLPPPHQFHFDSAVDLDDVALPGADSFDKFSLHFVVVPDETSVAAGCMGVIASLSQSGTGVTDEHGYGLTAEGLCRIDAVEGYFSAGQLNPLRKRGLFGTRETAIPANALMAAHVTQIVTENDEQLVRAELFEATKSKLVASLGPGGSLAPALGATANYEALRVASFSQSWQLADWLIRNIPMPAQQRLLIAARPGGERIAELAELI